MTEAMTEFNAVSHCQRHLRELHECDRGTACHD